MIKWVRFQDANGHIGFGRLLAADTDTANTNAESTDDLLQAMRPDRACELPGALVEVYEGDLFGAALATGERLPLQTLKLLQPTRPGKMIGLWNNFHALASKNGGSIPATPLYFLKAPNAWLAHGERIEVPAQYDGRVVYEGELGIVIGQTCRNVDETGATQAIFGYTCVNDMTALGLIDQDPSFAQWTRAKSFDTFGPFGPCIATNVDWADLVVSTRLNGRERQNYPASDMIFSPAQIVSLISRDLTLEAGDIIACGTSVGVLPVKAGMRIDVAIAGIGTLSNLYS